MGNELNRPDAQDIAFAAVFSGAVGSGTIALLFLILDLLAGSPLATPALVSNALFLGVPAGESGAVRMEVVAAFSLVHFTAFALLGTAFALLAARVQGLRERPLGLGYAIFGLLTVGVVVIDQSLLPGPVVETIGVWEILLGNASAAVAMTGLYSVAYESESAAVWAPGSARRR